MDYERVAWLCSYGVSYHTWILKFFEFIITPVKVYVCLNDNTRNKSCMDVACILVRTKSSMVLNKAFNVKINGAAFRIKVIEDSHRPLRVESSKPLEKEVDRRRRGFKNH